MKTVEQYLEVAFVLAVTGAAWVYPPAALFVAAAFFVAFAIIADRRTPPEVKP